MSNKIAQELNTIMAGEEPLKNLKVVQVDIDRYQVLSARNGGATMHEVNLGESPPTCSCEDAAYNRDGNEVCAHIAKAALVAESTFDADRAGLQATLNVLQQANAATDRVKQLEELVGRLDDANRAAAATAETTQPDSSDQMDPMDQLKDAMRAAGVPVQKLRFDELRDYIAFEPDGYLDDDEYGAFVEFSQSNDVVEYAPDTSGPDNRIKTADVTEVA